jgi:amphi-Trp domain-containing protein
MSDVKVELKDTVSRDDAAAWLLAIWKGLDADGHVELPLGASVVSVHVPDRVRAEVEVEVEGDEVEVEVEFKWSTARPEAGSPAAVPAAPRVKAQQRGGARKSARGARRLSAAQGASVDGDAVMMPTPVHCVVRPRALRMRVPRDRPGVQAPKARMDWPRLCRLAVGARQ